MYPDPDGIIRTAAKLTLAFTLALRTFLFRFGCSALGCSRCSTLNAHPRLQQNKWRGIAYAPSTRKLYAAPAFADGVLIVDPLANTTDVTAMAGFRYTTAGRGKWSGIAYAPSTGKLYAAPHVADAVLIIDPATNVTDVTAMTGLGRADNKWNDIAFSPSTGLLYASPQDAFAVLIIDPWANITDVVAMAAISMGSGKWEGIAFAPSSKTLYAPASAHGSVLAISHTFSVDACAANNPCARTCRASGCGWDDDRVLCLPGRATSDAATRGNYRIPGEDECAPFQLSAACAAEVGAPNFTLVNPTQQYVTGQSVVISGPRSDGECSERNTSFASPTSHPTSDDFLAIRFDLVIARDDGYPVHSRMYSCTNPWTGETTIGNLVAGNYTATLRALDGGVPPQVATLTSFPMKVKDHTLAITERCQVEQRRIHDSAATAEYFVGDGVRIPGFSASCEPSDAFEGAANPADMFFRLLLVDDTGGGGDRQHFNGTKLIDATTGEMLINARGTVNRSFTATLVAIDGGRNLTVAEWTITPKRHSDLDSASNGPNGRDCARGARVDSRPFDGRYECDCAGTGYTGDNCADAVPSATASTASGATDFWSTSASIASVAVVCLMLAALITFRVQIWRLKYRPVDVGGMQEGVMESLGLTAAKDIGSLECGLNLVFDRSAADVSGELAADFKAGLVAMLQRAAPSIRGALQGAKFTAAPRHEGKHEPGWRLLLVMQKEAVRGAAVDAAAEDLARKASKGKLSVLDYTMTDVNVAIPRRVPREVGRKGLTRIKLLGAGAFGAVHKYQLEERGSSLAYHIAAKSIKAGADGGTEEARHALLREAALGALLLHRNVVRTVGVCTVPRDVPALLLLAYCAEGSLEDHCADATAESMSVSERLTYCAQVLQGLQYISTRRIVHRDVASRNVLLDSTMVCKVSDFGMAAALVEDGKEYIRSNEQLALRWCAIEVIKEGKYSVQSDVWAFGVLAYEVFACGALPYADQFDNLTEISSFVKEGGKLLPPNPEACPIAVYEHLMLPCFAAEAANRPAFSGLYDAAVRHGAEEDDEAMAEHASRRQQRMVATRGEAAGSDRALLGPSVHHLAGVLVPGVQEAVRGIKKFRGHPDQASFDGLDPAKASIWHTVHAFAKPASESTVCPRDGEMGCAYVDTLAEEDHVGLADALLSYSWGYLVAEVSAALSAWAERGGRDPKQTRIWICSLCLNQHRLGGGDSATPEDLAKEFGERVVALGRILPMLEPWDDPGYVKRAWCLFELYTAITMRASTEIDIILSPAAAQSFRDRINRDGTDAHAIDEALAHVQSENAEASVQADLDAIRALIRGHSGGFGTLNSTVRRYLRRWFESHGGVKVVARVARQPSSTSTNGDKRARNVGAERVTPFICLQPTTPSPKRPRSMRAPSGTLRLPSVAATLTSAAIWAAWAAGWRTTAMHRCGQVVGGLAGWTARYR